MKTIKVIFLVCILFACNTTQNQKSGTDICLLVDKTDGPIGQNIFDIETVSGIKDNLWEEARFEYCEISNLDVNNSKVIGLPKENQLAGNPGIRELKVRKFITDVQNLVAKSDSTSTLGNSIIFPTIVTKLNALAKRNAANKHLIVYSNLLENSINRCSFYDPQTRKLFASNPEAVRSILLKGLSIDNIKGIHIWFTYTPKSHKENNLYMQILDNIYKPILEPKGVVFHIGNSITE